MLQLKAECVQPLQQLIRKPNKNKIVTCIFDDHIHFEKLNEIQLLPKDLIRIVHDYYDDKMIIECSYDDVIVLFNINDNNNKITYHYRPAYNMLFIDEKNFHQKDDSIMIISSSITTFNLSRLYYHYTRNNDLSFMTKGLNDTVMIDNDNYKYIIKSFGITYVSLVRNHEILQRRINVMKQLIDIIRKN